MSPLAGATNAVEQIKPIVWWKGADSCHTHVYTSMVSIYLEHRYDYSSGVTSLALCSSHYQYLYSGVARGGAKGAIAPPFFKENARWG